MSQTPRGQPLHEDCSVQGVQHVPNSSPTNIRARVNYGLPCTVTPNFRSCGLAALTWRGPPCWTTLSLWRKYARCDCERAVVANDPPRYLSVCPSWTLSTGKVDEKSTCPYAYVHACMHSCIHTYDKLSVDWVNRVESVHLHRSFSVHEKKLSITVASQLLAWPTEHRSIYPLSTTETRESIAEATFESLFSASFMHFMQQLNRISERKQSK